MDRIKESSNVWQEINNKPNEERILLYKLASEIKKRTDCDRKKREVLISQLFKRYAMYEHVLYSAIRGDNDESRIRFINEYIITVTADSAPSDAISSLKDSLVLGDSFMQKWVSYFASREQYEICQAISEALALLKLEIEKYLKTIENE